MSRAAHQYIDRDTSTVRTEKLFSDKVLNLVYSDIRERMPALFKAVTSARFSSLLGFINYDAPLAAKLTGTSRFMREIGLDISECLDDPKSLNTPRKVFERKIRYWETRPMPESRRAIVSPSDSRILIGSFQNTRNLFIKEKFFNLEELLGPSSLEWHGAFKDCDFAVFRLTPEKYHYNHAPVSGRVSAYYEIDGDYHSCNPGAIIKSAAPYSKNKRAVTIIDTDSAGGSKAGMVAMIEIAALMIGGIKQCYSQHRYNSPSKMTTGMLLSRGQPKSMFFPGSSTIVLLFQQGRIRFAEDLIRNRHRPGVNSRFSLGFGESLVETDIKARSEIANAR
ncbi:MAG TPA: phosphatidylserine decarboxylase [Nitrospirae bacterium]|nr:phosphatidylserine decarboxylase [Nitrospirota bacterium]